MSSVRLQPGGGGFGLAHDAKMSLVNPGAAGLSHLAHAKRVCALVETGSSALGLRERGTDLDVVCFVNDHVRLRRFLQHLPDVLMDGPGVTQALAIEGRVGHLELIIYELHVDLLLARLPCVDGCCKGVCVQSYPSHSPVRLQADGYARTRHDYLASARVLPLDQRRDSRQYPHQRRAGRRA